MEISQLVVDEVDEKDEFAEVSEEKVPDLSVEYRPEACFGKTLEFRQSAFGVVFNIEEHYPSEPVNHPLPEISAHSQASFPVLRVLQEGGMLEV